ncbi:MAG: DUF1905 domain-containing protein [Pseudorhodobacter sp.]|nr:DUF1905 domain-containing protein [Frankiaceae bacterium]
MRCFRGTSTVIVPSPCPAARPPAPRVSASLGGSCPSPARCAATIGSTTWTTSLIPEDGRYLLPLMAAVRAAEQIALGDHVIGRVYVETASHRSV